MAIKRNNANVIKVMRNGKNVQKVMRNNKVLFSKADELGKFYDASGNVLATFTKDQIEASYATSTTKNAGLAGALGISPTLVKKVVVPKGATQVGKYALYYLRYATECVLPEGLTTIQSNAFLLFGSEVSSTKINIPSTVNQIESHAFEGIGVASIVLPSGVTTIPSDCFYSSNITSISIPNTVSLIDDRAFYYCKNIANIVIPSGVTQINRYAFSTMDKLTSISIPNTVTKIGERAFAYTPISSINVPSTVTSISSYAFQDVPHIYYYGSATGSPWGAKAIN